MFKENHCTYILSCFYTYILYAYIHIYYILGEGNLNFSCTGLIDLNFRQIKKIIILISHINIFFFIIYFLLIWPFSFRLKKNRLKPRKLGLLLLCRLPVHPCANAKLYWKVYVNEHTKLVYLQTFSI